MSARPIDGPKYTLYGRPGSGSSAVEAMLALAGFDHACIDIDKADADGLARLKALNPLVQVPVLLLPDGEAMTESAAMMILLGERSVRRNLAPPPGDAARPRFLRLMTYMAANLYPAYLRVYYASRYTTDAAGADAVKQAAVQRIAFEWEVFDGMLGPGPFAFGAEPGAVDVYAAMLMDWSLEREALWARHPRLAALARGVASHPVVAPVWARHGISALSA